jgi:hypothetical protein
MKRTLHPLRSTAALLTAAACAPAAWAQAQPPVGVITYAGLAAAQAVPTLTQWGVLLLSLLLAPLAWRAARGRLACLALAGPGLLAAALLLDNAAGGSADIPYHAALDTPFADFLYQYEVGNATGQPLRITGTTLTPGHTDRAPLDTPRCTAGLVLAPGEGCYLRVGKPH